MSTDRPALRAANYLVRVRGGTIEELTNDLSDLTWSPNGTRIAFTSDERGGRRCRDERLKCDHIYVMDLRNRAVTRITNASERDSSLAWSPDGRRIAFSRLEFFDGRPRLFIVEADGGNEVKLTEGPSYGPVWSPDGRWIAFTRRIREYTTDDLYSHLLLIRPDGTGLKEVARIRKREPLSPRWSPDGSSIAVQTLTEPNPSEYGEAYLVRADGSSVRRLTKRAGHISWLSWRPTN